MKGRKIVQIPFPFGTKINLMIEKMRTASLWYDLGPCCLEPKIWIKHRKHGTSYFSHTFNCVYFSLFLVFNYSSKNFLESFSQLFIARMLKYFKTFFDSENLKKHLQKYRGFSPYTTFRTWKKFALAKNRISKIFILCTQ